MSCGSGPRRGSTCREVARRRGRNRSTTSCLRRPARASAARRLRGHVTWELRCSRGVLPRLLQALGEQPPLAIDGETAAAAVAYMHAHPRMAELRDYQVEAFHAVLTAGWGRIAFATNAGKGAVIAMLAD